MNFPVGSAKRWVRRRYRVREPVNPLAGAPGSTRSPAFSGLPTQRYRRKSARFPESNSESGQVRPLAVKAGCLTELGGGGPPRLPEHPAEPPVTGSSWILDAAPLSGGNLPSYERRRRLEKRTETPGTESGRALGSNSESERIRSLAANPGQRKSAMGQVHHRSAMRLLITEREPQREQMKATLRESCDSHALSNIAVYDA